MLGLGYLLSSSQPCFLVDFVEMASRYWTYLFENLERSISEIYEGCEKEENLRQCKVKTDKGCWFVVISLVICSIFWNRKSY